MLESIFNSNTTYTANIQTSSSTITSGRVGVPTWTTTKSVDCIFWRGGLSKSLVGEKFTADVAGVVLVKPDDISMQEIPSAGRVVLTDDTIGAKVNNVAGYLTGATTLLIDNLNDLKDPIAKNWTFIVSGEAGSPEHTVSSTVKTSGITSSITFTPALASAVADNTDITITPNRGTYSIIYSDNIAGQNEVIIIPVKEFT